MQTPAFSPRRLAVMDLGTNTFQLLLAEINAATYRILLDTSRHARIGEGGLGYIGEAATERAVLILQEYRKIAENEGIALPEMTALATSAVRSAQNREAFISTVKTRTGLAVQVIDGVAEAGLIYEGVRLGTPLGPQPSLLCDIGGGSVEFILCTAEKVHWQQSFEIGGQRLYDRFMPGGLLLPDALTRLYEYLDGQLLPLTNAVHQYEPLELIGSAGSFETLIDLESWRTQGRWPDPRTTYTLAPQGFGHWFETLLTLDRPARLALPGMKPHRVDLIIPGMALIAFLRQRYGLDQALRVSAFALKEGVLARQLRA